VDLQGYVSEYGYWAIFGAILLEDFGVPIPGETALIVGSVFAGQGKLNIVWVLVLGFLGAVIGDNIGYAIGRFGGRRLTLKYGQFIFITHERLGRAESFFHKYGAIVVAVARFIEILRQLNGLAAGVVNLNWWRFLIFNIIGAAAWVCFWGMIFYFLGEEFGNVISRYLFYFVLGLFGVITIGGITLWLFRHWKNKQNEQRGKKEQE
jgi:membrane protein DedA with SNARE-associated domain